MKMDVICRVCGRRWASDGYRVTRVTEIGEKVEYFTCERCKLKEAIEYNDIYRI